MATLDTTVSTEVPTLLPVAIAGHAYQIDARGFKRRSLPVLRTQADTTDLPSEQSLNPQGLWRRSQESWHHGAGQVFYDGRASGEASDPERFYTSAGMDIWTRGQVSLLNTTVKIRTTALDNEQILAVGNYIYTREGTEVYFSSDPTTTGATWTSASINAGQAVSACQSITTTGNYVWAALGSSGVHRTLLGATSSTADVPASPGAPGVTLVGYALGRLLCATWNTLYEIINPLTAPALTALYSHPDTNFFFGFISPGRNCIYAGGNAYTGIAVSDYGLDTGTTGEVYRIGLVPTSTALGAPTPATYLPDGESIYDVQFYAGGVLLATSRGLRVGVADAQGNIDYGPLINGAKPVVGMEPQGRYVWFTGEGYGISRLDLGYLVDTLTPAWSSDLIINPTDTDTAIAKSIVTPTSGYGPVFAYYAGTVAGGDPTGIYRKTANKVASGTIESGQIRFSTTESKTLRILEIQHLPLPAGSSILCELKRDGGSYTTVGTSSTTGATSATFDVGSLACRVAELRFTLSRATDPTVGPTLTRWTLHALPTPRRDKQFVLPLLLHAVVESAGGVPYPLDVDAEIDFLETLWQNGTVLNLQLGAKTIVVQIADFSFDGESMTPPMADSAGYGQGRAVQGTYTVVVQTVG